MPSSRQAVAVGPLPWRLLAAAVAPPADRAPMLDDLGEEYSERLATNARAARRWYRQQVLRSSPWLLARRARLAVRNLSPESLMESVVTTFLHDVRSGLRGLASQPVMSLLVIAILALGIAANTAIFSLINPILLRALPYEEPERLVHMFETDVSLGEFGWDQLRQSLSTYEAWREADSFEDVAAYYYGPTAVRPQNGDARGVETGFVTANLFPLLGVEPALGRNFAAAEDVPGNNQVVILSDSVWRTQFGADPAVVGTQVFVDGTPHVVVGVMDPGFNFPYGEIRMWRPAGFDPERWGPAAQGILTMGRLRDGVTHETATAELGAIHEQLARQYPDAMEGRSVRVTELRRALVFFHDELRAMMLALLVGAGLILLIVCANVANLMLAWSSVRRRDVAVRGALGAGRGRIVRQLLTENSLLAFIAAIAGIGAARAGIGLVAPVVPAALYRVGQIEVDLPAVIFSVVLAAATALTFGLVPALRASRVSLTETLKESRPGSAGKATRRFSTALIFGQVVVATFLCGAAAVSVGIVRDFSNQELGFEPEGVVTIGMSLPRADYPSVAEIIAFQQQAQEGLDRLPGVEATGWIDRLPLDFATSSTLYRLPEETAENEETQRRADRSSVGPGYFASMGIAVRQGREFDARDQRDAASVVVVNTLLADTLWSGEAVTGETLVVTFGGEEREATVVGVVEDSLGGIALNGMGPQVFLPAAQAATRGGFMTMRATGDMAQSIEAARAEIARLDPNLPTENVRTMQGIVTQAFQPIVTVRNLLSGFGVFAVLLAALGVYGVAAYAVAQRTHEIGVRMAIGASTGNIVGVIMRSAAGIVAAGAIVGVLAIFGLIAVLTSALGDPGIPFIVPMSMGLLLTAVAALASWLPARRATRVDPLITLRAD